MSHQQISPEAFIKLTIVEAKWIKDADFFGKQDPFIKWTHDGKEMKTTIKNEAGKHAVFNEEFVLNNISAIIKLDQLFKLESFDEDTPGNFECIGSTKGIPYKELIKEKSEKTHTFDLVDSKDKSCGSITIKTQFTNPEIKVTAPVDKTTVKSSQQQDISSQQVSTQNQPQNTTIAEDKLKDSQETPLANINWTDTELFRKYENKESTQFGVSDEHFSFEDIQDALEKYKQNPNSYRKKEETEPFYVKSLKSLELLMAEQQPNDAKFQKIREMYKEISIENTMKLMIRCKMNFDTRRAALELFELVDIYRTQYLELQDAVIRAAGNEDILKTEEIFCDQDKLNEIRNVSRVIKSSAQAVLLKAEEIKKREEKGERGGYTVLYENEDLVEKVLTQVKHIKQLLDKCKKKQINDDLKNIQTSQDTQSVDKEWKQPYQDTQSADKEAKQVQFEPQDDDAEVRRQSTKSNRKSANSKNSKGKGVKGSTGSGRGSTMSNKSKGSSRPPQLEPYANVPDFNANINDLDAFQQRLMKQHHQMFKTAHEGGFYNGLETDRSLSKKRKKGGKIKRVKNKSQSTTSKSKGNNYTQNTHTPISGISTEVGFNYQKPNSSLYGVKNLTTMKNPIQFANTGQNFFNHEKLSDAGMNMKHAMNRKLHLPNAMPRRQEMIYDLNGRPIFRSSHRTADLSQNSRSPRNSTQTEEFVGLQAHSSFITQQDKSKIQFNQQKKKASPLGLRTDYTKVQAHIFDRKRGSHMVPKQSNPYYNIQRDPVKVLHTQLSQISKQNVIREASQKSMSPPQSKLQNLPQISQVQKLPRPEAASEKAHLFNPRTRSTVKQQPMPNSYEHSEIGLNQISIPPLGSRNIQINKMTLNKSSMPDMNTELDMNGPQSQRDPNPKNLSRKLSPIQQKLNTERGMNSTQQMTFGHRRGSQAETSFGNIRQGQNENEDSKMDLSFVSQKQHKWPSPKRHSGLSTNQHQESAIDSLYTENIRVDHFTSQFSSVWLRGKEGMYQDHSIGSDLMRQRREANSMLFHMERQKKKMEKMQERAAKDALCQHYLENYGILPTSQQKFFLDPERLRLLLIKMATQATQRAAAMKIQNWCRGRLQRIHYLQQLKDTIWATEILQSYFRRYRWKVIIPRQLKKLQQDKAWLIQRVMRGYQARRKMLEERVVQQIDAHNDYWHRYKIVLQTSFQRRMRRVWLAFKFRKAEKKRKAAERAAAGKGKKKKKTTKPAQTLAEPSIPQSAGLSQTMKPQLTKQISSSNQNALATTMADMQKSDSQSQIFDDQIATKNSVDDVTLMEGDVVNINVAQSNNNDDIIDNQDENQPKGEGLDTINEEGREASPQKIEEGIIVEDMDRLEPPEGEGQEGGDGEGDDGEKAQ